ncbi:uncharacterized protein LOC115033725 [Acyrthosiphon pisum]|uniref:MULE transposase domain-containing protein n=1 Tax=Acyrthosiphon pisum TaxID=7029 RepID=A0A8R2JNH1_ACYPI|nr:uncharacterized protein LOC115033725 [Acyrthosiphon pisum]
MYEELINGKLIMVLPLTYCDLTIITDIEYGLINTVNIIFPDSKHQECYFHFCQAVIGFTRNKRTILFNLIKTNANAARVLRMILALPYLPAAAINVIPSMEDGFQSIVAYINQFPELANMKPFLNNYIWGYWFITIGPAAMTCYNQVIQTNNYCESYHASLLKLIKSQVREFLCMILIK